MLPACCLWCFSLFLQFILWRFHESKSESSALWWNKRHGEAERGEFKLECGYCSSSWGQHRELAFRDLTWDLTYDVTITTLALNMIDKGIHRTKVSANHSHNCVQWRHQCGISTRGVNAFLVGNECEEMEKWNVSSSFLFVSLGNGKLSWWLQRDK